MILPAEGFREIGKTTCNVGFLEILKIRLNVLDTTVIGALNTA
jgi:hypothetical protein